MEARSLRLDGRPVRLYEAGTGMPLVVVHGLGLSGRFWIPHFAAFTAAGFHIIAPDLPGFGESGGPVFGQSVGEIADWLLALAERLEVDAAAWLGHSLAAQAVLALAARAPARARALVVATPTGGPDGGRALRQLRAYVRDVAREPLRLVPAVAREYLRASPTAFIGSWLKAARDDPTETARRVRCPTLIVVGRDDPIVSRRDVARLCRRIPCARLAVLAGGAHGVVFGRQAAFDRVAVSFLREVLA
ncbi:MAG TPA: alpha/beta fold hydrolase [Longimicrobiales bacterium]